MIKYCLFFHGGEVSLCGKKRPSDTVNCEECEKAWTQRQNEDQKRLDDARNIAEKGAWEFMNAYANATDDATKLQAAATLYEAITAYSAAGGQRAEKIRE